MKIYLLRHTSLNIKNNIFYGQSDVDVSDNFIYELKEIKKKVSKLNLEENKTIVCSSPLIRCKKLTENLFREFHIDTRLKELHFGDWEMKKLEDIPVEQIKSWEKDIINFQIPNGESNKVFFSRLKDFCDDYTRINKNLFIVAHAGSINCIISYLTKIPFEKLVKENWKRIGYGSISILERKTQKYSIELFGDQIF